MLMDLIWCRSSRHALQDFSYAKEAGGSTFFFIWSLKENSIYVSAFESVQTELFPFLFGTEYDHQPASFLCGKPW